MALNPHLHTGPAFAGLRIGLLGGSFNPAHAGHRAISLYALKRLGLHQVWWLVSPQNPLKPVAGMASFDQRVQSARAMARHPRMVVSAMEGELGTRYTVDTLNQLRKRYARTQFVWLMGADNLRHMDRWHKWQDLFAKVPVAVFRRPAYAAGRGCGKAAQRYDQHWISAARGLQLAGQKTPAWLVTENVLQPYSATKIREDLTTWPK